MYGYQNYWEEEGWCEVGGVNCSESPWIKVIYLLFFLQGYSNSVMVSYVLDSMENLSGVSPNSRTVLKSLSDLFVLWGITENSGSFLEVRKEIHK